MKKETFYTIRRKGHDDIDGFKTLLSLGYYAEKNNIIDYEVRKEIRMSR